MTSPASAFIAPQVTDSHLFVNMAPDQVAALNDITGFPYMDATRTPGVYALDRRHAFVWLMQEEQLCRQHRVPAGVSDVIFDDIDSADVQAMTPEGKAQLSADLLAWVQAFQAWLKERHLKARAALENMDPGAAFTGEQLLEGLIDGDGVVLSTDTGELPCLVQEIRIQQTMLGVSYRARVVYLAIRNNGQLSWHRGQEGFSADTRMTRKNADIVLMDAAAREHALERGQEYVKLATNARYARCEGFLMVKKSWSTEQLPLKGRVMVDPTGASETLPRLAAGDSAFGPDYPLLEAEGLLAPMLCFTPQWVPGFSFKHKRWGLLSLDELHDIEFRDQAFSQLVLEEDVKDTVRALVQHSSTSFTDFVEGKSGGCVFLLYGPPGAGKTLTAESVAEVLHRPLYVINVGELGTTPSELESALKSALQTAERWDAVVLLDEADVFLERRASDDIVRNALVGIFLRELEYYRGVLFLTTNRARDLDPAIISRVSLGIRFQALDENSRLKVWENLCKEATGATPDFCLKAFAAYPLHGRQIKNAFRMALTLGKAAGEGLTQANLKRACELTAKFMTDCTVTAFQE